MFGDEFVGFSEVVGKVVYSLWLDFEVGFELVFG